MLRLLAAIFDIIVLSGIPFALSYYLFDVSLTNSLIVSLIFNVIIIDMVFHAKINKLRNDIDDLYDIIDAKNKS